MGSALPVGTRTPATRSRWCVVGAAVVLNLVLGALYSWPVFSSHLERSLPELLRWKHVETQLVFSMATVFLAVGVIVAGQLSERHPPRRLILVSAAFTGGGYLLGGLLPLRVVFVAPTIGMMVGFGIGVAYALPISLAARWFPDRRGLVTGIAMAGFGLGSVLWSQAFHLVLDDRIGISGTFALYGILFAGLILLTMRFLVNPPAGYAESLPRRVGGRPDHRGGSGGAVASPTVTGGGFVRSEIVTHRQFYYLSYAFVVGSAIGLMVIGMSKSYPAERLVAAGYPAGSALYTTSLAALVLLAMCYGGNFTVFPVATGQIWGPAHLTANYSLVFIAFGVGALVGPPLSGMARDAGMIDTAFRISSGLLATSAVLVGILRTPERRRTG